MKTSAIIEGLTILQTYNKNKNRHSVDAEHGVIFVNATDIELGEVDVCLMNMLGWFQGDPDADVKFTVQDYNPLNKWLCIV